MPRRSVTRFFIPLIDVLILLFCIFLLMPFVSGPQEAQSVPDSKATTEPKLPEDVKALQTQLTEANLRLARLEKERHADYLKKHVVVSVLDIDRSNGVLYYNDPQRQEIRTQADAIKFITRQQLQASKSGMAKDVFFLIRYPRVPGAYPTGPQRDEIDDWFKDVAFGFDIPRGLIAGLPDRQEIAMGLSVLSFGTGITDRVEEYAVKCLTVVGAGLVGYFLGGIAVSGIDKWLLKEKTPAPLKKACRWLIGAIAAIVMAMLVFGEGGSGLFGGGGEGKGKGKPGDDSTPGKSSPAPASPPKSKPESTAPSPSSADIRPTDILIHVTVYGGAKAGAERYYQIDDERTLKTFKELKEIVLTRKRTEPGRIAIAIQQPADKSDTSGDPRLVSQVTDWAQQEGILSETIRPGRSNR